jgi:hypothetical protein
LAVNLYEALWERLFENDLLLSYLRKKAMKNKKAPIGCQRFLALSRAQLSDLLQETDFCYLPEALEIAEEQVAQELGDHYIVEVVKTVTRPMAIKPPIQINDFGPDDI